MEGCGGEVLEDINKSLWVLRDCLEGEHRMDFNSRIVQQKKASNNMRDLFMAILLSMCACLYYELWASLATIGQMQDIITLFINVSSYDVLLFFCMLVLIYSFLRIARRQGAKIADFVYRWRYIIGAVAVLLLVAFNISGSSIHFWSNYIQTDSNGVLLGNARSIRSDEWVVSTPFAFSQVASGLKYFASMQNHGDCMSPG